MLEALKSVCSAVTTTRAVSLVTLQDFQMVVFAQAIVEIRETLALNLKAELSILRRMEMLIARLVRHRAGNSYAWYSNLLDAR